MTSGLPEKEMRVGMVLPTFALDATAAFAAAHAAEDAGVHGVFCYDHLWPMGQPGRPAISPFPILGALSSTTSRIALGTLVARIGLVPDAVLLREFLTIEVASHGRLIAGVGTGDHKSAAENEAYGIAFPPMAERRAALERVVEELQALGVTTWVGGGSATTNALARRTGASLNLWSASVERVARAAQQGPVTWGGVLPKTAAAAGELFGALRSAGASWAVVGWPGSVEPILEAARRAELTIVA